MIYTFLVTSITILLYGVYILFKKKFLINTLWDSSIFLIISYLIIFHITAFPYHWEHWKYIGIFIFVLFWLLTGYKRYYVYNISQKDLETILFDISLLNNENIHKKIKVTKQIGFTKIDMRRIKNKECIFICSNIKTKIKELNTNTTVPISGVLYIIIGTLFLITSLLLI